MSSAFNGNLVMNPSGTSGNFHNGVPLTDWGSYATIFDEYKVNQVVVTVRQTAFDDSIATQPQIWMASTRDNALSGSLLDLQTKNNVVHHVFTPDNPVIKLVIKPYMASLVINDTGTMAGSTRKSEIAGWLDTESTANLYGWLFYLSIPNESTSLTANQVVVDIEYDISWRYRSG